MDIAEDVKAEAARWMLELQSDLSHRVSTGDVAEEPLVQTYIAKAIQAERDRCEWQDISTAPKDGTAVLVVADWQYFVAWWMSGWTRAGDDYDLAIEPTNWMPLPPYPSPPKDKP